MLNYHRIQTLKRLVLVCIAFFMVAACSTIPNNNIPVTTLPSSQVNKPVKVLGDAIVQSAKSQLGVPYRYGGNSPNEGFDCSGLAMYSYRLNGISIPRSTSEQFRSGKHVNRTELDRGDLLFFRTMGQSVSHVGIYMGNDTFIHAPSSRKSIQIETLDNPYYKKRYLGARRYW